MWVLKFHGETYYVNHVDAMLPWSTKETPDNSHTKGALKFKKALVTIDEHNNATITELTVIDRFRLRNQKLGLTRIMFEPMSDKRIKGACSTTFIICDILNKADMTMLALKYADDFRILMPNEIYYREYDRVYGDVITADYSDRSTPYEYS
jgi:hypothetical protein